MRGLRKNEDMSNGLGISAVPGKIFKSGAQKGVDVCSAILADFFAAWTLRLHALAQGLENAIPVWRPFVVDIFDPAQIQEKILSHDWKPFCRQVVAAHQFVL